MELGAANNYQSLAVHGGRGGEINTPSSNKSEVDSAPVRVAAVENVELRATEQERFESIRQAIKAAFSDTYAVSDQSFSIFKDSTGQYVTRLTSLRDGSVSYIPEPNLLRNIEDIGFDTSLLKVNI